MATCNAEILFVIDARDLNAAMELAETLVKEVKLSFQDSCGRDRADGSAPSAVLIEASVEAGAELRS